MYFRREVREVSSDIRADHGSQYRSELTVIESQVRWTGLWSNYCISATKCCSSQLCNLAVLQDFVWPCLALPSWLVLCRHPDSPSHHSSVSTVRIRFLQWNNKSSGLAHCGHCGQSVPSLVSVEVAYVVQISKFLDDWLLLISAQPSQPRGVPAASTLLSLYVQFIMSARVVCLVCTYSD